jgi:hypothetical protein
MRGVSHKAVGLLFGLLYEPIRTLYALSIKLVQADSGTWQDRQKHQRELCVGSYVISPATCRSVLHDDT